MENVLEIVGILLSLLILVLAYLTYSQRKPITRMIKGETKNDWTTAIEIKNILKAVCYIENLDSVNILEYQIYQGKKEFSPQQLSPRNWRHAGMMDVHGKSLNDKLVDEFGLRVKSYRQDKSCKYKIDFKGYKG